MQTSVPKHTPWLCQPATFRPQCTQTQSPTCNIQTTVSPNTVHGFVSLQHSDHSVPKHKAHGFVCPAEYRPWCTQTQSTALPTCNIQTSVPKHTAHGFVSLQHSDQCTQTHSPQLCLPGNIQTTVYPNTQSMALSTCNIQTTVYPNTVHGFVILQQLDHSIPKRKAQPETFRPQCTQTHSPWLCQPATFRLVYPNTQPMALSACNIQTGVPKHTAHGFVSLQHSDWCTQTHSPWLCQPATLRPVYPNTQSMALSACNIQTTV